MTTPLSPAIAVGGRYNATHRHSQRTFWKVLGVGCKAAIVVHVAFGLLFAGLGLPAMAIVNAGSVGLYLVALFLLGRRRNTTASAIVAAEIVAHAWIAATLLGLDSGFQYYLLVIMPLIFVSPERATWAKVAMGAVLVAIYLALDLAMHESLPSYAAPKGALGGIRAFNIVATFVLLARLAHSYFGAVQRAEARLRTIASTDPLTGALNRRSLLDLAGQQVAAGNTFAVVIADVDHFKAVNDTHGHECGDRVLVEICRALHGAVRPDDEVARWGGEEFVLLLPCIAAAEASAIAERARRAVETLAIDVDGKSPTTLRVTMTFGVAAMLRDERPEACIARADDALYRGKAAGRNRVTSAA